MTGVPVRVDLLGPARLPLALIEQAARRHLGPDVLSRLSAVEQAKALFLRVTVLRRQGFGAGSRLD